MAIGRMAVKRPLQAFGVFCLLRAMARRRGTEQSLGTECAAAFDRNISKPFSHSQCRFLHYWPDDS
jgi:hypothetical protein